MLAASVATAWPVDASTRAVAVPPVTHPPAVNPIIMVRAAAPMHDQAQTVLVGLYSPQFFIIPSDMVSPLKWFNVSCTEFEGTPFTRTVHITHFVKNVAFIRQYLSECRSEEHTSELQ